MKSKSPVGVKRGSHSAPKAREDVNREVIKPDEHFDQTVCGAQVHLNKHAAMPSPRRPYVKTQRIDTHRGHNPDNTATDPRYQIAGDVENQPAFVERHKEQVLSNGKVQVLNHDLNHDAKLASVIETKPTGFKEHESTGLTKKERLLRQSNMKLSKRDTDMHERTESGDVDSMPQPANIRNTKTVAVTRKKDKLKPGKGERHEANIKRTNGRKGENESHIELCRENKTYEKSTCFTTVQEFGTIQHQQKVKKANEVQTERLVNIRSRTNTYLTGEAKEVQTQVGTGRDLKTTPFYRSGQKTNTGNGIVTVKDNVGVKKDAVKDNVGVKKDAVKDNVGVKTDAVKDNVGVKKDAVKDNVGVKKDAVKDNVGVKKDAVKDNVGVKKDAVKDNVGVKKDAVKDNVGVKKDAVKDNVGVKKDAVKDNVGVKKDAVKDNVGVKKDAVKDNVGVKTDAVKDNVGVKKDAVKDNVGVKKDAVKDNVGVKKDAVKDNVGVKKDAVKDNVGVKKDAVKDNVGVKTDAVKDNVGVKKDAVKDNVGVKTDAVKDNVGVKKDAVKDNGGVKKDERHFPRHVGEVEYSLQRAFEYECPSESSDECDIPLQRCSKDNYYLKYAVESSKVPERVGECGYPLQRMDEYSPRVGEYSQQTAEHSQHRGEYVQRRSEYLQQTAEHSQHKGKNVQRKSEYSQRRGEYSQQTAEHLQHRGENVQRKSEYSQRRGEYSQQTAEHSLHRGEYVQRKSEYSQRRGEYSQQTAEHSQHRGENVQRRCEDLQHRGEYTRRDREYDSARRNNFEAEVRKPYNKVRESRLRDLDDSESKRTIDPHNYTKCHEGNYSVRSRQPNQAGSEFNRQNTRQMENSTRKYQDYEEVCDSDWDFDAGVDMGSRSEMLKEFVEFKKQNKQNAERQGTQRYAANKQSELDAVDHHYQVEPLQNRMLSGKTRTTVNRSQTYKDIAEVKRDDIRDRTCPEKIERSPSYIYVSTNTERSGVSPPPEVKSSQSSTVDYTTSTADGNILIKSTPPVKRTRKISPLRQKGTTKQKPSLWFAACCIADTTVPSIGPHTKAGLDRTYVQDSDSSNQRLEDNVRQSVDICGDSKAEIVDAQIVYYYKGPTAGNHKGVAEKTKGKNDTVKHSEIIANTCDKVKQSVFDNTDSRISNEMDDTPDYYTQTFGQKRNNLFKQEQKVDMESTLENRKQKTRAYGTVAYHNQSKKDNVERNKKIQNTGTKVDSWNTRVMQSKPYNQRKLTEHVQPPENHNYSGAKLGANQDMKSTFMTPKTRPAGPPGSKKQPHTHQTGYHPSWDMGQPQQKSNQRTNVNGKQKKGGDRLMAITKGGLLYQTYTHI